MPEGIVQVVQGDLKAIKITFLMNRTGETSGTLILPGVFSAEGFLDISRPLG
jgi:hypothetical protein